MAATLTNLVRSVISIGSEAVRVEVERTIALLNVKYDAIFNVPENSGTIVTLWDVAATGQISAWSYGIIIVDPGNLKPTLALPIRVTQTISAPAAGQTTVVMAEEVTREVPLFIANRSRRLDASEVLAALTNFTTTGLTKIQARNAAAASGGANDVQCRLLLVGV